jgi:two-component system chemotaxis response regulator CheB
MLRLRMAKRSIVVIGASAGGLQALSTIVQQLPPSLPASVLIVVHSSTNGQGVLPRILQRVSALPVAFAENGDVLAPGRIFVARPDFHLILSPTGLALVHGPRENGFRPAVDPLFRTAARELGPRVIGVILSGGLSDGTYGLSTVKHHGGVAIVQDPQDAVIPNMPQSAIEYVDVDYVVPAAEIGLLITRLAAGDAATKGRSSMPRSTDLEPQLPSAETEVGDMNQTFGAPSGLTCPDCGGALWEVQEGRVLRYQCHVGHQYAPENLEAGQRDAIDSALWSAVRVLEEHADLKTRMSARTAAGGMTAVSKGFAEGARDARQQAHRIRTVLFNLGDGNGAKGVVATRARRGSAVAAAKPSARTAAAPQQRRRPMRPSRGRKKT